MDDDLFTCEVKIHGLSYFSGVEQQMDDLDNRNLDVYERKLCYVECEKIYAEAVIFINKRLVRLIDVTVEQWLDLKCDDHTMKQKEVYGLDAGMEYDPSSTDFSEWFALKFSNHKKMDWYTKNALWIYWTRGDDEEVIIDDELSNPEDRNLIEEIMIGEIFRIETDIFQFETPLCEAFKELNYLLMTDVDVLTNYILGFKTYKEYKDDWIYEWNKDVPWVANMPWRFASRMDMLSGLLAIRKWKNIAMSLKDGELKDEALNSKAIFEGLKGVDEESSDNARTHCSPNDKWDDFKHANHIGSNVNSNYNPYLYVSRIFNDLTRTNNDYETQENKGWFDKDKLMGDDADDIGDLEDDLIQKDHP
ncbi:hypothetical protein Tco_0968409 [Tanacetum coccineum]